MNTLQKNSFQDLHYWKMGSNFFGPPQMYVYCFLIDGLLIDTGQPRVKTKLLSALEQESIQKIVLTHHHEDHSGNVEAIKKQKNIPAYASAKCCDIMKHPPRVEPARWFTWGQMQKANLLPLQPQEVIQTDHYAFETMDTLGHAIDQISLYEPTQGWLFSGDLYVHDYIKVFMRDENMLEQIQSIKKLLKLDFDVLLCNHQPIFSNGKARLQTKLNFLEDFYGLVEKEHAKGLTDKEILQHLKLKENQVIRYLSLGQLSRINMVRSVLKTIA